MREISELLGSSNINDFLPFLQWIDSDANPAKNNETRQQKGTQERSTIKFGWETSTRCFNKNKNLGIFDLNPMFNAKQEPRYKEDATNGGGNPFDKSMGNATENFDKFE
ncbi:hypothetical protein TIFTF001_035571 [Ficus carica]|uniref:Uncharacterized protein n=1 Tax=Ficus carica TaxID=3494 RepID=A0AA88J9T1_FICCA|nr:hypothetical protein TIFTF001_035546 [Ficus carica]GMN66484.1 hypothetical protein TIFTF001_035551 [Ficus carica]GMN66501.1 hypothetical protein TIFTF001_035565 [Ficus carica]GMN66503.1 hypothetical protein TIFTF001_035571 [Ficus carica]